uniref:zinc finger and BTB domain-containing protein 26-like n=1 Tax=Semicossyphus pulcher TaxID=241346 RepID=UPI0037E7EEEE
MSGSPDSLLFRFPAHADSILSNMNALRQEHRFCDITLLLGGPPGSTVRPLRFHAHRVVLAASSDFLRDQFLLHEGRAELSVGVVSNLEVGRRLLLSCYTGLLEVPLGELVNYLTAASALQMTQVAEKCAQAISQYLSPTLAFLNLEMHSEEKEIQHGDSSQPGARFKRQEERDVAQPGTSNQEVSREECKSKMKVSQGSEVEGQGMREARDDRRVVVATKELSEGSGSCPDTLELEEGGDIRPVHTHKSSYQADQITGGPRCSPPPATAIRGHMSSKTGGSSAQHEELLGYSRKREGEEEGECREEEEMFMLAAQLQDCEDLPDSELFRLSGSHLPESYCSGDELTDDSDSLLVQRPYLCRRCDRVFQHLQSYVGHLKEHRQYLCLVCGKGFSQRSNLTRHIRVHTGVKPFRCPLCHKTFFQKATLQDHLNLHTGDKPHKCQYCAMHFAHKTGLRRHLKGIHGKCSLQNVLDETVD